MSFLNKIFANSTYKNKLIAEAATPENLVKEGNLMYFPILNRGDSIILTNHFSTIKFEQKERIINNRNSLILETETQEDANNLKKLLTEELATNANENYKLIETAKNKNSWKTIPDTDNKLFLKVKLNKEKADFLVSYFNKDGLDLKINKIKDTESFLIVASHSDIKEITKPDQHESITIENAGKAFQSLVRNQTTANLEPTRK